LIALDIFKPRWFNPAGFFVGLNNKETMQPSSKKLCSFVPLLFNFCGKRSLP